VTPELRIGDSPSAGWLNLISSVSAVLSLPRFRKYHTSRVAPVNSGHRDGQMAAIERTVKRKELIAASAIKRAGALTLPQPQSHPAFGASCGKRSIGRGTLSICISTPDQYAFNT
jgi:hypothetical protein